MPPHPSSGPDPRLLRLVNMALVLTGLSVVCGLVIVDAIVHPGRYQANETAPVAAVAAVPEMKAVEIVDGKDVESGFVAEGDYLLVKATCTGCHSSALVLQNRATREGWESMIRWMQETQKLWDLGENEDKILDYLATYYAPKESGRRPNLEIRDEDWYFLE